MLRALCLALFAAWVSAVTTIVYGADETVIRLSAALAVDGGPPGHGWWFGTISAEDGGSAVAEPVFSVQSGTVRTTMAAVEDVQRFSVARYTVPQGKAGFHAIEQSFIRSDDDDGEIELRVWVRRARSSESRQPPPAVQTRLRGREVFDFDAFVGYLDVGDDVCVGVRSLRRQGSRPVELDFAVTSATSIAVAQFFDAFEADANQAHERWNAQDGGLALGTPAARRLAWNSRRGAKRFSVRGQQVSVALDPLHESRPGAAMLAFRVPQSGYYAFHEASVRATGGGVDATVHVGMEHDARRELTAAAGQAASLNADLGYIRQGEVIYLSLAAAGPFPATAELAGSIVEWAPRRAALRVRRGADGLLDVFEPEAPLRRIDVPADHWVRVPATSGDATDAIRHAIASANAMQRSAGYVGVQLESGRTYILGSAQVGGVLFAIRDCERLVFDGNGAVLEVASPELARKEIELFTMSRSRNIVFADLTVTGSALPFTVGEILRVDPPDKTAQTVTFRVDPDQPDPIADIRRDGKADGFAYDPDTPGRLAVGTWTHFPGDGPEPLQKTDDPRVFTHRVRRTGLSIQPGQKWLIKNKGAGVVYLTTQAGAENVTLTGIRGRAAGGTHLRFWQTSGVNILDCTFQPEGDAWISSSSDSIHGRGREGPWIENTVIRGVCEDIMNTYGENMVVIADDDPSDAVMSIRMFRRHNDAVAVEPLALPGRDNILPGDQLVFFNPRTGRVLGYANVLSTDGGRFTLSNSIDDVDTWEEGDGKGATMVYNTRAAGRFFVRDSRFADSMRYGIYIKARGGVIFHTQFEGLSSAALGVTNEPEWPEGPPATHLWVQDCFFSQNNYGYQSQHRAFMTVDPADISVYTRKLGEGSVVGDEYGRHTEYRAHVTKGQFANSHLTFLDNVFHDWRGMALAVRNARNVRIEGNLFLAPVEDQVLRKTLAADTELGDGGVGRYAAMFIDSVNGGRMTDNRFHDLPAGDKGIVQGADVGALVAGGSVSTSGTVGRADAAFSIGEWSGATSAADDGRPEQIRLGGAKRALGRVGAGLLFDGHSVARIEGLDQSLSEAPPQLSISLWARPAAVDEGECVLLTLGDKTEGILLGMSRGRWTVGCWRGKTEVWLDLGAPVPGTWQHLGFVWDGSARSLRGFVDGLEVASSDVAPAGLELDSGPAALGGQAVESRMPSRGVSTEPGSYTGGVDEIRIHRRALSRDAMAALAYQR